MKKLIIGALLLLICIPGFSFNLFNFITFSAGLIPALMIVFGAIAVYLGLEELKQPDNSDNQPKAESPLKEQEELNKESTGKPDGLTKPVPDTQSTKAAPKTKTEEKTTDKQPEAQPEEEAPSPSTSLPRVTESLAPEEVEPASAGVQFKGNIETRVFHSVACNFASGKNCSMDFTTKEKAEAQGYKPCKICMPDA